MKTLKVMGEELKLQWSPTFAQKATCPAFLKFRYIDRIKDSITRIAAERGKATHAAKADLIQLCMDQEMEVKDLSDNEIQQAVNKHTPASIAMELGNIVQWVHLWRDRFELSDHVIGIEEKIALGEDYEEISWWDASYRGILDLLEGRGQRAIIWDWKTQPNIISQSELDDPFGSPTSEQFTNYAWLTHKMYPQFKDFTVRLWFSRYGFYIESRRTMADVQMFEEVQNLREKKLMEVESWDPVPGKHCQYCDFIRRCPLAQDLSPEATLIATEDQATLAASRVTVMEELRKTLNKQLKSYVEANDDVRVGDDWVYGNHVSETPKWDPWAVKDLLEKKGFDPMEVMRVDVNAMKKLMKTARKDGNQHLADKLEGMAKMQRKTQFKGAVRKSEG